MASRDQKTSSGGSLATIRDVTVTFDGYLTRVLSRVNLDIRRGEVLGILGAKGAGKSTLLRLLAGRVRATEGKVKVFGRSPRGSTRARVGYVPGKSDAGKSAGFFHRLLGRKRDTLPATRGGAGLTQAIIGGRDLIVLDEPFAEAEPAQKAELKTLVRELAQRGKTVIVASDTLVDAKDVCDRLVVVHEGRILAIGSLEELLGAPSAIRYLAPVLPPEIGVRIGRMLREEITRETALQPASRAPGQTAPAGKSDKVATADEHLTALTRATENGPSSEQKPNSGGSIDHDKLEELTKPAKPE